MNTGKYPVFRTALGIALAVALVFGIVAAATIFSIAQGTEDVAAEGVAGIVAEATLSAAAAAHNATGQSQVVAEARSRGVATSADLDESIARAEEALTELDLRTRELVTEIADTATRDRMSRESGDLAQATRRAIASIRSGDLFASTELIESELHPTYEALAASLVAVRNDAFSEISMAGENAGRLADAARFLVVLLLPMTILVGFRNHIRRAQRQRELEGRLEKEQAVSRTKSEFISHLSHELRTPLTSIYGSALELHDPLLSGNTALQRELTTIIADQSAHLTRMVEDILALAADDHGQLSIERRPVAVAEHIVAVLEPLAMLGYKTLHDLEPGKVIADPHYLDQVVSNLVMNAHRHGDDPVTVRGFNCDSAYTIEVVDNGTGVPADVEARLFNRYVHEGDSPLITGSVGLGLCVAEILVTGMGGEIEYGRRDNTTVFTVRVAAAPEESSC